MRMMGISRSHFFLVTVLLVMVMGGFEIWMNSRTPKAVNLIYGSARKEEGFDTLTALPDNGMMIAGHKKAGSEFAANAWLMRLDQQGRIIWQKTFTGHERSHFERLQTLSDGTVLTSGYQYDPGIGQVGWLSKISLNGRVIWEKRLTNVPKGRLGALVAFPDGGAIVAGYDREGGLLTNKIPVYKSWIVRLSEKGKRLWQKELVNETNAIRLSALRLLPKGGVLGAGIKLREGKVCSPTKTAPHEKSNKFIDCLMTPYDAFAVKLSKEGEVIWQKRFPGTRGSSFRSIVPLPEGGVVLAGADYVSSAFLGSSKVPPSGQYRQHIRLMRLDEQGHKLWEKACCGQDPAQTSSSLSELTLLPTDHLALAGYLQSQQEKSEAAKGLSLVMDQNGRILAKHIYRPRRNEDRTFDLAITDLVLSVMPFADHFWTIVRSGPSRSEWTSVRMLANGRLAMVGRVWGVESWNGWLSLAPKEDF